MNIDEFRAYKKELEESQQREEATNAQTQPSADGNVSPTQTESTKGQDDPNETAEQTKANQTTKPSEETVEVDETSTKQTLPEKVEVDGEEYTLDELRKGYMRMSDYTRKTQEAKRKEKQAEQAIQFMQEVQQNPQLTQQLSQQYNLPQIDPVRNELSDLQEKYYDLLIDKEVATLSNKYPDFDAQEVLTVASNEKIENLETAYHIVKGRKGNSQQAQQPANVEEIINQRMEEFKAQFTKEQQANADTSTIIQNGGDTAPVRDTTPQLSAQEQKVARSMGMKPEEYAQWRDAKPKKS